jgi:hypothetical protein
LAGLRSRNNRSAAVITAARISAPPFGFFAGLAFEGVIFARLLGERSGSRFAIGAA